MPAGGKRAAGMSEDRDWRSGLVFVPFVPVEKGWPAGDDRIRAGAVLRVGGEDYLVGDVNELLGVCDDCRDFRYEDIDAIAYLF